MKLHLLLSVTFFVGLCTGALGQSWTNITTDASNDGATAGLLDGTALDYYYDNTADSLWFRITTSNMNSSNSMALGFNVMVNYSGGGSTFNFWGTNNNNAFHRLVTGWVTGTPPSNYSGTMGIANSSGVSSSNYTNVANNNLDIVVTVSANTIVVGMPRTDLIPNSAMGTPIVTAAAVGSNQSWNDDIYSASGTMTVGTSTGSGTGNHDIGCTSVNFPTNGMTIFNDQQFNVGYTRENFAFDIPANYSDTVFMDVTVNGNLITSFVRNPASAFLSGVGNAESSFGSATFTAASLGLTVGTNNVCVATRFASDTNAANDISCVSVTYGNANYSGDLGITDIELVTPSSPSLDLADSPVLSNFNITVKNFANTPAPQGLVLPITMWIGSDEQTAQGILGADLAPDSTTQFQVSSANLTLPALPMDTGGFQLCSSVEIAMDANSANDAYCLDMYMMDSDFIDPSDPNNWPSGIRPTEVSLGQVFYANGMLHLSYAIPEASGARIIITDMRGAILANEPLPANAVQHSMALKNMTSGTYVATLSVDKLMIDRVKFVVTD